VKIFHYISIHPEMIDGYTNLAVFKRAQLSQAAIFHSIDLRRFAFDSRGSIDDRPYGGGDGMVMRADCLEKAVKSIASKTHIILTSPQGKTWSQEHASRLSKTQDSIVFICGRFDGVDQRFIDQYVDEEFSLGNFILSGGELAALAMTESVIRLLPGVLGNEESSLNDSFSEKYDGGFEHPIYTRPPEFNGEKVPEVLLSGDHKDIEAWRKKEREKLNNHKNK